MGGHTRSNLKRMARVEKINRYYDLEIRNLERTSRELLLDTSRGKLKLSSTERDEGFLHFLLSAQQHLWAKGFKEFAAIHPSKESAPFIKYHGQVMVLEDQVEGEEFTYTRENIARGMETLARFHIAARGIDPKPGSKFKITWGKWPDRCFKEVNDLVRQKILLKDRRLSGFDARFAEHVDRLIERGLMAWQRFNNEAYRKMLRQEMDAKAFNLHNFKAGNLKIQNGRVVIADMSRIRFEVQIYDLAHFLDEILEKSDLPVQEVAELTAHYSRIRPWTAEEHEALIAFLLYPKGLFRLIRHYYRSRRGKNTEVRFDNLWRLLEREEELVQCLNAEDEDVEYSEKHAEQEAGSVRKLEDVASAGELTDELTCEMANDLASGMVSGMVSDQPQTQAKITNLTPETTILLNAVPDSENDTDTPEASIKRLREVMGELLSSVLGPQPSGSDLSAKVQASGGVKPATVELEEDAEEAYVKAQGVARAWENVSDDKIEARDIDDTMDKDGKLDAISAESMDTDVEIDAIDLDDVRGVNAGIEQTISDGWNGESEDDE